MSLQKGIMLGLLKKESKKKVIKKNSLTSCEYNCDWKKIKKIVQIEQKK